MKLGDSSLDGDLPTIVLDLWFEVDDDNVHRVIDLLPGLDWSGEPVGIRMVYTPKDQDLLLRNFRETCERTRKVRSAATPEYQAWPRNLFEYLERRLPYEYEIRYYVLDFRRCDDDLVPQHGYEPYLLGASSSKAAGVVRGLIRVDFLNAQRHLTDSESSGRAEDLSRRLSRYYQRNLPKLDADTDALNAIENSEAAMNEHFANAFGDLLNSIGKLGYPGFANLDMVLKASFNAQSILSSSARVHYALPAAKGSGATAPTSFLPDQYNGLGFKNLIYLAVEIQDFHHAWADTDGERAPVHLVMVEEPEAHLHAQLQQVFINKAMEFLPPTDPGFETQMVVTTHSSHILYERSFDAVRYFCRAPQPGVGQCSEVKNLSTFCEQEEVATRKFLQQYLKLTHCDLFFADAAVLVEGNVERLVVPLVIENTVPELRSCHLTILEVGGAFTHKFENLLNFLEITALVITDLDSVYPPGHTKAGKACMTTEPAAVTSNETLRKWLPKQPSVAELLDLSDAEKVVPKEEHTSGTIRLAYQTRQPIIWSGDTDLRAARTLEEAFALENLKWTQHSKRQSLGLVIPRSGELSLETLHEKLFERVRVFDKTKFALGLLADHAEGWRAPHYIVDGLKWLRAQLRSDNPALPPASPAVEDGQ